MKINKFIKVDDFRIFQQWRPTANAFRDINVVYANNGSGKSTLAELLNASAPVDAWSRGVVIEVDQGGGPYNATDPSDPVLSRVIVFNRRYVEDAFDFDASHARALLTLGTKNVTRERDLREKRSLLLAEQSKQPALTKERNQAERLAQSIYSDLGRTISAALGSVHQYSPRLYNAGSVKKSISKAMTIDTLATFDAEKHLAIVQNPGMSPIALQQTEFRDIPTFDQSLLSNLLSEIPTATAIPRLLEHANHSSWVQTGLAIHDANDHCFFCDGVVTKARLDELGRHFDASTKNLQKRIKEFLQVCERAINLIERFKPMLPDENLLYDDLRVEYSKRKLQVLSELDQLSSDWKEVKSVLEEKYANLFVAQPVPQDLMPTKPDLAEFVAKLDEHNARAKAYAEHVATSATLLEAYWIGCKRADIAAAEAAAATAKEHEDTSRKTAARLASEISALEHEELDPAPSAEWLNHRLSRLLGRSELQVKLAGGEKYQLQRHGVPALHLSEGEKTVLTLLYFIKSLSSHSRTLADSIIVIDDPVSSLDENFTVGVSALIWAELVQRDICRCGKPTPCNCGARPKRECGQLFLFTHNFELFRIWTNQLDRLDSGARKAGRNYRILELRTKTSTSATGSLERVPEWYEWDEAEGSKTVRSKLRSEYHYLFWRAADTLSLCTNQSSVVDELDAAVVLPNVCRRLLEGFLSFRFPEKMGDFRQQMRAAIDDIDDGATRQRLVTFLHQYSHNEQVDTTRGINRPESVAILRAVFELIQIQDPAHFEGMCQALDINPTAVLAQS
ncbi:AAA family ATPase [Rhodococcus sp. NPDC060084]|uniref:AAA family ATPase n=1 Tax=Rhodococcus sp. NPDC060084 TaxID=3347053 RepID=UPI00364ECB28